MAGRWTGLLPDSVWVENSPERTIVRNIKSAFESPIAMQTSSLHIVVTGPESTGKTTLSRRLADHFGGDWVPEYARYYLEELGRPYRREDLLEIAQGQWRWERHALERAATWVFSDTSLLVLKVWSEYRYGTTDDWILEHLRRYPPAGYLLCAPDLPWEPDPQRENPHDREVLFDRYRRELEGLGAPYRVVRGTDPGQRFQGAVAAVADLRG